MTPSAGAQGLDATITKHRWVVYAKKPFAGPEHVFRYLGRYTHRVGIANSRLLDVADDHVTFRTKDGKAITLTPVDFLARFVQHVLPKGFVKIRHFGLYAATHVKKLLERARALLRRPRVESSASPATSFIEVLLALTGRDVRRWPRRDDPAPLAPNEPQRTSATRMSALLVTTASRERAHSAWPHRSVHRSRHTLGHMLGRSDCHGHGLVSSPRRARNRHETSPALHLAATAPTSSATGDRALSP